MSLTTTSKRRKRGLHNHPAPLDMTLLGVPGSLNPRTTVFVSAARLSIKKSVAALGLNYPLSSGDIPDLPPVPKVSPLSPLFPKIQDSLFSRSPPNLVLDISSCSPHYTTTDTSAAPSELSLSTTPPNLAKLQILGLPTSPVLQEPVDSVVSPSSPPSEPCSPITPPLLTPALARPTRRWGMTVFPQDKAIRRISSAPSSPIFLDTPPASPTSIIAIKSPVERRDSRRISDALSLMSPFIASFPHGIDVPPPVPPKHNPLPPIPTADGGAEMFPFASKVPETTLGTIKESDSPVKVEEKEPRSPIVKKNRKLSFRRTGSHYKRIPSTPRRENHARGPHRRLRVKRDSGAPFATATESVSPSALVEWAEMKEGQRNTGRWSASKKYLQMSSRKANATVVMMRKGREKAKEKDIAAVIPQLRELKVPKRLRL